MAEEERGGVQNVWLLFIALGLGLLVVVIYNVHIYNVRREGRGRSVLLLRLLTDMEAGKKLTAEDLESVPVPRQHESSLGNVVPEENRNYAVGQALNRAVEKGRWLLWEHITGRPPGDPAYAIGRGNVAVAVPLNSKLSPGDILRPNNRVNLVGLLPVGSSLKTFRIMEGVRVLAIGGEGIKPSRGIDDPAPSRRAARSYSSITVEVSKDVSLEFANVLTHVSGSPWVELISSRERSDRNFGRINPLLKDLAKSPSKPPASVDDWD